MECERFLEDSVDFFVRGFALNQRKCILQSEHAFWLENKVGKNVIGGLMHKGYVVLAKQKEYNIFVRE